MNALLMLLRYFKQKKCYNYESLYEYGQDIRIYGASSKKNDIFLKCL